MPLLAKQLPMVVIATKMNRSYHDVNTHLHDLQLVAAATRKRKATAATVQTPEGSAQQTTTPASETVPITHQFTGWTDELVRYWHKLLS